MKTIIYKSKFKFWECSAHGAGFQLNPWSHEQSLWSTFFVYHEIYTQKKKKKHTQTCIGTHTHTHMGWQVSLPSIIPIDGDDQWWRHSA